MPNARREGAGAGAGADEPEPEPDVLALCSEPGVRSTMPESCEQLVREPRRSLLSSASISVAYAQERATRSLEWSVNQIKYMYS